MDYGEQDSGRGALDCLRLALRLQGVAFDPETAGKVPPLREDEAVGPWLVRLAQAVGCRAQEAQVPWERLIAGPLPVVSVMNDGTCRVIAKASAESVLVHGARDGRPEVLTRASFEYGWGGRIIRVTPRRAVGTVADAPAADPLRAVLRKYRRIFGEILVLSFFIQVFAVITPLFFQVVVDKVLVHQGLSTLDVLAVGLLAVVLFEAAFSGIRTYLHAHTSARVDVELSGLTFRHLVSLPLAYFDSRRSDEVFARVREVDGIRGFLTGTGPQSLIDLLFSVVFLAVMYFLSPSLCMVVLVLLPLQFAASALTTRPLRERLRLKQALATEGQTLLGEVVRGISSVKSTGAEGLFRWRWENLLAQQTGAAFRVSTLSSWSQNLGSFFQKLGTVVILWMGAKLVIGGELTVGSLIAFNMLAGRVSLPTMRLVQSWQEVQQVRLSLKRLRELFAVPVERGATRTKSVLPRLSGEVTLSEVTFRYRPDAEPVLKAVSLVIPAGQVVCVVGESGSGKSSLAKLLQRLYVPEAGRVAVDGVDLAAVNPGWLRRQIGVVPQETHLFSGTVRENIALADPSLPMEQVVAAAKLAGAHDFILTLPDGYDTVIGDGGAGLSGGQRQRLTIARVLIGNPRLLILDEATSALDEVTERRVLGDLRRFAQGRTVIVITHRPNALAGADRVIRLDKGRVVADERSRPVAAGAADTLAATAPAAGAAE